MIVVSIDSGAARNRIAEITRLVARPRAALQASARGMRLVLQKHFTQKNKKRNKLGGRRTNFWSQVRASTQIGAVTANSAEVVIGDHRFTQKLFGGPIRAKQAKALTIPVHKEAHGRRASALEAALGIQLFILGGRGIGNGAWLAAANDQGITVYYALKQQVNQDKDPTALPPTYEIEGAAVQAASSYLETQAQKQS